MNSKEIFKRTINWIIGFVLVITTGIIITLSASVVELRNQKEELVNQKEDLLNAIYMTAELKNCPMCGATVKLHGEESFYIECDRFDDKQGCGLKTGYYKSKETLIKNWNNIQR